MNSIALFQQDDGSFDVLIEDGDFVLDNTLYSDIAAALFSDRPAQPDDPLPYPGADRRGWWGDAYAAMWGFPGDQWGSRLWLLDRAVLDQDTLNRAREYCDEALSFLVDDQLAKSVATVCTIMPTSNSWMQISVTVTLPDGTLDPNAYNYVWKGNSNAV